MADNLKHWQPKLARLWPEKPEPKDMPMPASVTEAARANVRSELESAFEDFLRDSRPEDIAFMRDVLSHWRSENGPFPEPQWGTCQLAESFAYEIDRRETYIRVPAAHKKDVIDYANMLLKASGTDERAY